MFAAGRHSPFPPGALLMILGLLAFVGLTLWLVFAQLRRRARESDAAFVPLGFTAAWYMRGRQYDGVVAGRAVHAWVLPPAKYRGSSVGITMRTGTRSALSVGPRLGPDFVRELLGRQEVALGPDFSQHVVSADEPARLFAMASDPRVRAALLRVARGGGLAMFFKLEPGEARVLGTGMVYAELLASPALLHAYLDDMACVAAAAEAHGL